MQTVQTDKLKTNIDDILKKIENDNEEFFIEHGKEHKKIAVIIPYSKYAKEKKQIKVGYLKGKAKINTKNDFSINDNDFLNS